MALPLILFIALIAQADHLDEASLLPMCGDGCAVRKSLHFLVVHELSEPTMDAFIGIIESTYDAVVAFCEAHGVRTREQPELLRVVLFDRPDSLDHFRRRAGVRIPGGVGGYDQRLNVALFSDLRHHPNARSPLQAEVYNRLVLQHEIAHQVLFNRGIHSRGADNPSWWVEGLACQFELHQPQMLGMHQRPNALRLADLCAALAKTADSEESLDVRWQEAITSRRLVLLSELIADDRALDAEITHAPYRYAQAWALVHYLRAEHREGFKAYLDMMAARAPGDLADSSKERRDFESCFGPLDEAWTRRWLKFAVRLPVPFQEPAAVQP